MTRGPFAMFGAVGLALIMVASGLAVASSPPGAAETTEGASAAASAATAASPTQSPAGAGGGGFATNAHLASTVADDERALETHGGNGSTLHPPNLHEARSLRSTGGNVAPLYDIAPAPMGVAYYGLSNTTGTIRNTTANTTSLAGTFSTTDPLGEQTEEFDDPAFVQPTQDAYGAQLNAVLVNVSLFGQTSFYNPKDPDAPTGCPSIGAYVGLPGKACPNEFWMQNFIEYTVSTHRLQIGDEIWNFSNAFANWSNTDDQSAVGFGSIDYGLYGLAGVGYGPSLTVSYPFTVALYINTTRGLCHLDTIPGTGVPSCTVDGSTVSETAPVNEIFFNYTVWNAAGQKVCPVSLTPGTVCGEYDDVFFNSVSPSINPHGVPRYGPDHRIGSATIQANGSAYDPVGLTNDYEMDYGIGSDDGSTNGVAYANGTVGIDYCANAHTRPNGECSAFSATPAASDFGGETGETSTGELSYWSPQAAPTGAGLLTGAGAPLAHLVTGPSLLLGLWNMSGTPYPGGSGDEALSYAHIAPANAWIGIAAGAGVTDQSKFQVAPTFGWFSYWSGSGGSPTPTRLGSDLYLPKGMYTIEVLLSGYTPVMRTVDLTTAGQAPHISLTRDLSTGVYTPEWAFSSSDLKNLSVSGAGTSSHPYVLLGSAPTVGAPYGTSGSLSWLFSDLNDYLFTVWIGAYLNGTSAVAQFDPAPSLTMVYPTWQDAQLSEFGAPTTDQFQFYLYHVQNFALTGATHLYSWAGDEAVPVYSVICNSCENVLIASNTFAVSYGGIDLENGGTTAASLSGNALVNTRNVVWNNTFARAPPTAGVYPARYLISFLGEAYDRVYDNRIANFSSVPDNGMSGVSDINFEWWNATCQAGYHPLASPVYPGAVPCEPLSYAQTLDGVELTGSIIHSSYQGGNFWGAYGNTANPYGNLPVVLRAKSPTAGGLNVTTVSGAGGDYAPLIGYSVYRVTFTESGLPRTMGPSAFTVRIDDPAGQGWYNGTGTSVTPGGCAARTVCLIFYLRDGNYSFAVSKASISSTTYVPSPAMGSIAISKTSVGPISITFGPARATVPAGQRITVPPVGSPRLERSGSAPGRAF
jgi:hypothetical protein